MQASTIQSAIGDCEIDHLCKLGAKLNAMRQNASLTDVTLLCGEREFQAHRLVLSSSSPYFHSALTNGWLEMTTGYIDLMMISAESMEAILEYMYTGQFNCGSKDKYALMELVENSDYLQIDGLFQFSFRCLAQLQLTTNEFVDMYDYVQELGSRSLINQVVEFLAENYVKVSRSPDFRLLTVDQLKRIIKCPSKDHHASMELVFTSILEWTSFEMERIEFLDHWMTILGSWCAQCLQDLKDRNGLLQWHPKIVDALLKTGGNRARCKLPQNQKQKLLLFGMTTFESVVTIYDVEDNEWCTTQVIPFNLKSGMDVVVYQSHAYFFGGGGEANNITPSTAVIKYCPFMNTVLLHSEDGLAFPVFAAEVGVLNDLIYIVNGLDINYSILNTVQCYDPLDDTCRPVAPTNKGHYSPTVMPFRGSLFIVGSADNDDKYLERYDPVTDQWTIVTEIPGNVDGCVAALCDSKLFVVRDCDEKTFDVYDFQSATWTASDFDGGPAKVNWLWAMMRGGRQILFFCDFTENCVHQYDVKCGKWVAKSVINRDLGDVLTCCKLWCDLLY